MLAIGAREPEIQTPSQPTPLPPRASKAGESCGEITFEGVTFQYDGSSAPTLQDINLTIPAGSTVAIVGKTGSGKSTLVRLIARQFDPNEGRVLLDGAPLPDLPVRALRSEIGFVTQDPFLFSMTLGNNLRFGLDALEYDEHPPRPVPTTSLTSPGEALTDQDARIAQALRVAGLSDDIDSFPEGLETLVGERGITLSGGQKQRVTIARALLVDPRVLILDDALASVDSKTEAIILDHLEVIMEGRTSILLTHRYNALPRVDHIFVMDEGRVVEQGSHDDLLAIHGLYAEMYEQQKLREQLDDA